MAYEDLFKDPRWQRKRLEVLSEAQWRCRLCFSTEKTLNVHHKRYRRGAAPWEYENSELEVLCDSCHEAITEATRALRAIVAKGELGIVFRLSAYAQALAAKRGEKTPPVPIYTEDQLVGVSDAFAEAAAYGLIVTVQDVGKRLVDGRVDVVQLAKDERKALDDAVEEWAAELRK